MTCRPGPLQPYDIHIFSAHGATGTPSRPHKRPHSPGIGSLYSPAKRRLKAVSGTTSPKYAKSPLSASSSSARFAPAHFQALLQGPDSPAKKLDFASDAASDSTLCEGGRSGTPRRSPKQTPSAIGSARSSTSVRRSTRLAARRVSRSPENCNFSSPSDSDNNTAHSRTDADDEPSTVNTPLLISRVVTPPDRQSVHYPGFDIYQDSHVHVPVASSAAADTGPDNDKEHDKENRAPRWKSSKKLATPVTPSGAVRHTSLLMSPTALDSVKHVMPASPHPKHVHDYLTTPRERNLRPVASPVATLVGATPRRIPISNEEKKLLRRAMERELDDGEGDDDEDEDVQEA